MFDVFYLSEPVGIFPHERFASCLADACDMSHTRYLWIVDHHNDYSDFDWLWEPSPWQDNQMHVWPSQHQLNGGTYLVPRGGYTAVNRDHAKVSRVRGAPIVGIDHGNGLQIECEISTRFIADYLGTLRRVLSRVDHEWVWVVSSVCDYRDFDFSWHPSEWQREMLHVFPSGDQQLGDTFYVHVPSFLAKSQNLALLEWFETIHTVEDISVHRHNLPVIHHDQDSHVDAVRDANWTAPLMLFCNNRDIGPSVLPTVSLWRRETRTILPVNHGASRVIVPRDAVPYIKTQLYDYPHIDRSRESASETPLDIVFIDNGEYGAQHHWEILKQSVPPAQNLLHRSTGVNGRVAAYQAAAKLSTTPWFFAVFAKLQVNNDFDWTWQPDRLQQAKHYIFHALNPVNNLIYGHQAIIAKNRKMVLDYTGQGLDFTLDQPHEVVPVISGTAYYNNNPWTCWRTAFRECLKLRHSLPDVENEYRLDTWLTVGEGMNARWSLLGASDAVNYYEQVQGDIIELRRSYEWDWLASYALLVRPELFV